MKFTPKNVEHLSNNFAKIDFLGHYFECFEYSTSAICAGGKGTSKQNIYVNGCTGTPMHVVLLCNLHLLTIRNIFCSFTHF